MKPKQLHYPFSWETRRPHLEDQVFWVPEYYSAYENFSFPTWAELFGNHNPVCVEYCSGNGSWLIGRAAADPSKNWVAIEKRFDRVRKIWSKAKNRGLHNILIVCGEGLCATRNYFTSESVAEVYVNFPDPWPKDRHAKHRIIQGPFVAEMERILSPEGQMTLVTDDPTYSQQMLDEVLANPGFSPMDPAPHYITEYPGYGGSFFEELWKSKGRTIHYHRFARALAGVS